MGRFDSKVLDEHIKANSLNYPKSMLVVVSLAVAFEPVLYSHAVNGLSWASPVNAALYAAVGAATAVMLQRAYATMVESDFWSRQRDDKGLGGGAGAGAGAAEGSREERLVRKLRLQLSVAYSLFFVNLCFFVLCTLLLAYIFRHVDPRAAFMLSPSITAALLWFVAQKNEESRQRRMRAHN